MITEQFPRCCGARVLVLEHLTGKGEKEDMELIKSWVYYERRNGYRHYDFPQEYGGKGGPGSGKAVIGGEGDRPGWNEHNSIGMLLAITNPGQVEIGKRLEKFGFKHLFTTHNPVYGPWVDAQSNKGYMHSITLWGLDMNPFTEDMLKPGSAYPFTAQEELAIENPFATVSGTLGKAAGNKAGVIEKAPEVPVLQPV